MCISTKTQVAIVSARAFADTYSARQVTVSVSVQGGEVIVSASGPDLETLEQVAEALCQAVENARD